MLRRINVQSLNGQSGRGLKRLLSYPKDTVGWFPCLADLGTLAPRCRLPGTGRCSELVGLGVIVGAPLFIPLYDNDEYR